MESFLATRKEENLGRINELAQVLLNNHIMVAMITTDRDGYMERQKRIMDEVLSSLSYSKLLYQSLIVTCFSLK